MVEAPYRRQFDERSSSVGRIVTHGQTPRLDQREQQQYRHQHHHREDPNTSNYQLDPLSVLALAGRMMDEDTRDE